MVINGGGCLKAKRMTVKNEAEEEDGKRDGHIWG